MASDVEITAMRRAIALAAAHGHIPDPNPRVGCVLLSASGAVLAEAGHRGAGTLHAEAEALTRAGAQASGATAVVTLEPCAHQGRTGPCCEALLNAGVRRVVFAQADPNPVASGGTRRLRAAGVEVEGGVLESEARQLNEVWTFAVSHQRPFVTWKFAATLDGRSAAADGTSRWVTSAAARRDVHHRRGECDTVLVGTGTVLADDPRLTVRDDDGNPLPRAEQPLRAVMGLRPLPATARVLDDWADTVALTTRDPDKALAELFDAERRHVWLEGGPTLAGAFVAAGLVDEVVAYVAPALLGAGPAALTGTSAGTLTDALRLELTDVRRIGPDLRVTARPHTAGRPAAGE